MSVAMHQAVVRRCCRWGVEGRRFFADREGDVDGAGTEVGILLNQIVGEGGVEKAIDVHVVLDKLVVALVVLSSELISVLRACFPEIIYLHRFPHALELFLALEVFFPGWS